MKYHSFYMRVLCLLLIIGAVVGYNFMSKNNTQAQEIEDLKERVTTLENQQTEILTALRMQPKQEKRQKLQQRLQRQKQPKQTVKIHPKQQKIQQRILLRTVETIIIKTELTQDPVRDLAEP